MEILKNQLCPLCKTNNLELKEEKTEVPHFGNLYLFSMHCSNCHYSKTDVEGQDPQEPSSYTITVDKEEDMNIKVIKSSTAAIKIPQLRMSVKPGPASDGYITNIEGVLKRFEEIIESERDNAEDEEIKKKAKNLLKKIRKVKFGDMPLKIIIEDPSGNSSIISEKAEVKKIKP